MFKKDKQSQAKNIVAEDAARPATPAAARDPLSMSSNNPHLKELIELAGLSLVHLQPGDGCVVNCNPGFLELLRLPPGSILGRPLREFIHEDDLPEFQAWFGLLKDWLGHGRSILGGPAGTRRERHQREVRLKLPDGSTKWVRITLSKGPPRGVLSSASSSPSSSPSASPAHGAGVGFSLTGIIMESGGPGGSQQERDARYQQMVEHLPVGAVHVLHLPDGTNEMHVNRQMEIISGFSSEELCNMDAYFSALFADSADEVGPPPPDPPLLLLLLPQRANPYPFLPPPSATFLARAACVRC
eukprot:jgi/Mesen1/8991/ME000056S08398